MDNNTIAIDNTFWSIESIKSFTSVNEFVSYHSTCDWLSEEYLRKVYEIVNVDKSEKKKKA